MPTGGGFKVACFASSVESSCCVSDQYLAQCFDPYCEECIVDAGSSTGYGGAFPRTCEDNGICVGCQSGGSTCPGECKCQPGVGCGCYTPGTYNPIACTGGGNPPVVGCNDVCNLFTLTTGLVGPIYCNGTGSCEKHHEQIVIDIRNLSCDTSWINSGSFEVDALCNGIPVATWVAATGGFTSFLVSSGKVYINLATKQIGACGFCGANGLSYGVRVGTCPSYLGSGSLTNNCQ